MVRRSRSAIPMPSSTQRRRNSGVVISLVEGFLFLEATSVIMFVPHKVDTEEGFESMSFAVTAELIGASRKNYASCHKYSTNCGFIPIPKKENPGSIELPGRFCEITQILIELNTPV